MSIKILIDSACDLDPAYAESIGIKVLPLRAFFGEEEFLDNVTMSHDDFFNKLIETDVLPKTSLISPGEYEDYFNEATANGDQVICITLSSKLSGCYQSAFLAAQEFDGNVIVVDSENACVGQRILAEYALMLIKDNLSLQEIVDRLEIQKKKIRLVALLDTLEYLHKGGRISATVATAGKLLSIKPVIAIQDGVVALLGKARGSKAANNKLHELIMAEPDIDFDAPVSLAYSGLSSALLDKYVADHQDLIDQFNYPVSKGSIGCAIGTHVGPGAIAVAFMVK